MSDCAPLFVLVRFLVRRIGSEVNHSPFLSLPPTRIAGRPPLLLPDSVFLRRMQQRSLELIARPTVVGRKVHAVWLRRYSFSFPTLPLRPLFIDEGLQRSLLVLDTAYPRASTGLTRLRLVGRVSTFHCLSLGIRTRTFVFNKPIS